MNKSFFIREFILFIIKSLSLHSFLYLIGLNSPIILISLFIVEVIILIWRLSRNKPR